MGRHTVQQPDEVTAGVFGVPARLGLVAAGVVTVIGAGVLVAPEDALARLPWSGPGTCTAAPVEVVVTPELAEPVQQILAPLAGRELSTRGEDGPRCAEVSVRAQEPQETVAGAEFIPVDRAPQVWIPDASAWGEDVSPSWKVRPLGSLATSPVVLLTSVAATKELGWEAKNPTWGQALRGARPVAVPDYQTQSESLEALIALWQSLRTATGKIKYADQAVVQTVLAADRDDVPDPDTALAAIRSGSADAPIIPAREQQVVAENQQLDTPVVKAVYPREGSPVLDYPILRVDGVTLDPARAEAVSLVTERLASSEAVRVLTGEGFRGPDGKGVAAPGIVATNSLVLKPPAADVINSMIARVDGLARPSRILAVIDVSLSMRAELDDGISRIALAGAAARLGANLLPDRSAVGAWLFASEMRSGKDWTELAPVNTLGARVKSGETHRSSLMRLATDVDRYLTGGGTSLYDVTLAAAREMHRTYDPKSVNAIILLSDGANEDSNGADLGKVLAELKKLNAGKQKVAIFTAGLGPDADYEALRKIALTSGGYPYRIDTAAQGQQALLDGLRRSRRLGG